MLLADGGAGHPDVRGVVRFDLGVEAVDERPGHGLRERGAAAEVAEGVGGVRAHQIVRIVQACRQGLDGPGSRRARLADGEDRHAPGPPRRRGPPRCGGHRGRARRRRQDRIRSRAVPTRGGPRALQRARRGPGRRSLRGRPGGTRLPCARLPPSRRRAPRGVPSGSDVSPRSQAQFRSTTGRFAGNGPQEVGRAAPFRQEGRVGSRVRRK